MSNTTIRMYERFPLIRRIEHITMMLSFITLGLTGLPQKYPNSGVSVFIVNILGGIENLRSIHHVAAIVMMLGTIWHLLYFGYMAYVRHTRLSMLPSLQDAKDALQAFMYNLGFSKTLPQMGRYTFEEKMEYWAFVWGTAVMVATGFMMWNPIATVRFFPGEVVPAAKAAHGGEAVLAVLAIIIWHMYGVHIKRLNKSMFTGQMSEEDMLHEHPLELADIKAGVAERPVDPVALRKRQSVYFPVAAVLAILMVGGVFGFVNAENTALETTERRIPTIEVFVPQTPTPLPTQPETALTPSASITALTWEGGFGALFQAKCGACHGADGSGGLNLSTYVDALKGADLGAVIIPNDAANSPLVVVQQAGGHFGQLSPEELAQVIEWINAGAPEK